MNSAKFGPNFHRLQIWGLFYNGGTAAALQMGHRESVDFVFFTDREFAQDALYEKFPFLQDSEISDYRKNTLSVTLSSGVKISFFGDLKMGRVGEPVLADNNLQIASLDDLMAFKLKVLFDRVEFKDYFDIVCMLQRGISLEKGLASARLFWSNFPISLAIKNLTYFEGGDLEKLTERDKKTLEKAARFIKTIPSVHLRSERLPSLNPSRDIALPTRRISSRIKARKETHLGR